MPRPLPLLVLLTGCGNPTYTLGGFTVDVDRKGGTFDVVHEASGGTLLGVEVLAGHGSASVSTSFGSFLFEDVQEDLAPAARVVGMRSEGCVLVLTLANDRGVTLGDLVLQCHDGDVLLLDWAPLDTGANRAALEADLTPGEPLLGLGGHALDVDHQGEAFGLWVSEPGIGKVSDDEPPEDWFVTGTRHSTSYPVPFLLRPHAPHGLLADTTARVEVDLGATDPGRLRMTAWEGATGWVLVAAPDALGVVEGLSDLTGRISLPPAWAFAPWNDAVRGSDRVREVAAVLREAGVPASVIWTEDWKGGEDGPTGYHLKGEWFLDETLYPDAAALDADLEDQGFKWLAYFSPFVTEGTVTWDEAVAAGVLVEDAEGEVLTFTGVTFKETALLDLTSTAGREWGAARMEAALDLGFDGWMGDYGEWLPTDAVLASGEDALAVHNRTPVDWQALQRSVVEDQDATFFARSGWLGAQGLAPVVWAGDQRTSFDTDDGLPTVVALGLGLAASGVPVFTHDVAGYQSVGNDPSDQELWLRWASLGAYSPVLRTHHGAFHEENWQFDTDTETLAFWAEMCREHVRLFPYRYGLAARAASEGTPMILPSAMVFPGDDWGRVDGWMLGDALFVAPVLERGATGRQVDLPPGTRWYRWDTLEPAESGWADAPPGEIPVFVAAGRTVPLLREIPDTLVETAAEGWTTLAEVDTSRDVLLVGGGGAFTEADGTSYAVSGTPTGSGEVEETLTSGTIEVAGVRLSIEGPRERTYRVVVVK